MPSADSSGCSSVTAGLVLARRLVLGRGLLQLDLGRDGLRRAADDLVRPSAPGGVRR